MSNIVLMDEQRTCKTCGFTGPLEGFKAYTKKNGTVVHRRICRDCRREELSAYHKKRKAECDVNPPEPKDEVSEKRCSRCDTTKPIAEFPRMEKGRRTRPECRPCYLESQKQYREQYPNRSRDNHRRLRAGDPDYYRKLNLKHFFKLTIEDVQAMLDEQGGFCAICGTDDPGQRNWTVDHDHACCPGRRSCGNCLRGVLCIKCNLILGTFNDDPVLLQRMINYLTRRPNLTIVSSS